MSERLRPALKVVDHAVRFAAATGVIAAGCQLGLEPRRVAAQSIGPGNCDMTDIGGRGEMGPGETTI